ncbi:MAG: 30S ribosomal protein S20 [Candidatus Margulisbacteria bacterium]|nr:30S ribosomal protein S20 [Candidatus Margulisiibacteriota bacterium]
MANIKSAKKRILIIKRNTLRNRKVKDEIKGLIKNLAKKHTLKEDIAELLKKAIKSIDSAVSKGVLHWKAAARKKSRLVKKFTKPAA